MYLYAPCRLLIGDVRGLLAIPCTERELMMRKMFVQKLGAYKLPLLTDVDAAGGLPVHGLYREGEPWVLNFW